jgi:hypothetical protein
VRIPAHFRLASLLAFACVSPALAQNKVDGKWAGVIAGPQGDQTVVMNLSAKGDSLAGTISDFQGGESPIEEGMIRGDTISFYQSLSFNGNLLDIFYSALVHAEELLFTLEVDGMPQPLRFTVKRAP